MNLYLLEATAGYEEYDGFVIAAPTAKIARELAQNVVGPVVAKSNYSANQNFVDPKRVTCVKIGTTNRKRPYIVLASNTGA